MKWLDRILGKEHTSASWQREAGFRIDIELDRHALCRCKIGDPIEWLSGLGPPEDARALREQRYCYYSRGFDIGEEDSKVSDFVVYWLDYLQQGYEPFQGIATYRGKEIPLNSGTKEEDFIAWFGKPYWRDQDKDEIILFYEFPGDIEWQVEFTLDGLLKAMRVVWPALMEDEQQRKQYGVTAPWPPE